MAAWQHWPGTGPGTCPCCGVEDQELDGEFDGVPGSHDPGDDVDFTPDPDAICSVCQDMSAEAEERMRALQTELARVSRERDMLAERADSIR